MEWTRAVDGYCERLSPAFWAEPVNALTNLAFLLAAWVMWRRLAGSHLPKARALAVLLALIGLGSFAFHTVAQVWAAMADTLPILAFALLYIFAANRDFWRLGTFRAGLATAGALAAMVALVPLFAQLPVLGRSAGYWPLVLLFVLYGAALWRVAPATGRGLMLAAGLLALSLTLRSLDMVLCPALPIGTHFGWHLINATLLAWVIEVYRRHMLAPVSRGR